MYEVGVEMEFLDRVDAGAVAVLEPQVDRRRVVTLRPARR